MSDRIAETWGREPVGYRQGELNAADGVATTAVTLIGGPALVVGASLISDFGLDLVQVLLVAPIAAIIGGALIGGSAQMAADTGAHSTWLLRPSFGTWGAWFVSLTRLCAVALWAVVGLLLVAGWGERASAAAGLTVPGVVVIGVVAVIGLLMIMLGLVRSIQVVFRRPLFWSSVVLMALVAWSLLDSVPTATIGGGGPFWPALQFAVELAVVFVPFFQTVARRLADEDDALTSFGVGYTVPATVMMLTGAVFAGAVGGFPFDLTMLEVGMGGALLAVVWVVVAEVDQAFSALAAVGAEGAGVIPGVPVVIVGVLFGGGVVGAALYLDSPPFELALLATAVAFPAALIAVADFFWVRGRLYAESDLHGAHGITRLHVAGVVCWVLAVIAGQVLDPVGPAAWVELFGDLPVGDEVPWRLAAAAVAMLAYVVTGKVTNRRNIRLQSLRGV